MSVKRHVTSELSISNLCLAFGNVTEEVSNTWLLMLEIKIKSFIQHTEDWLSKRKLKQLVMKILAAAKENKRVIRYSKTYSLP